MYFAAPFGFAQVSPFVTEWNIKADNLTVTFPGEGSFKLKYKAQGESAYSTEVSVVGANHETPTGKKTKDGKKDSVEDTRHKITFPKAGIYEVVATGLTKLYARDIDTRQKEETLILLKFWGNAQWESLNTGFEGYKALKIDPQAGNPDLSKITSLERLFASCWVMNSPTLKEWNVSKVTNFNALFADCRAFNQDLAAWSIENAEDLSFMFAGCTSFSQELTEWKDKVAKCTTMEGMFNQATLFNGNVGAWKVGNVTNMKAMFAGTQFNGDLSAWDVSKVTNMNSMFEDAKKFEGKGLGNWQTTSLTSMERMFKNAAAFNGDVSGWKVGTVTNMTDLFENCTAFNHTVKSWDLKKLVTEGARKIGLQDVDYSDALLGELITEWSSREYKNDNGEKPGLYIQSTGLYYPKNLTELVKDLTKKGGQYWTIEARPFVDGMFEFTPPKPINFMVGQAAAMPSFEGRFLSHHELIVKYDASTVRSWKVFDGESAGEKIDQTGGESTINVNRDFNVVAIFRDKLESKPGKHLVRVYVYGSGKGTVTGTIGGKAVTAEGGAFYIKNSSSAKAGDVEAEELTIKADDNSTFRYYMTRIENNEAAEEEVIQEENKDGVKVSRTVYNPMGYYRFGGEGEIKVKIPKSTSKSVAIDIVFDSKEMQKEGEYNLYFSAAGRGKIEAFEKIGTKKTPLNAGKNTIKLDGKTRDITYRLVAEPNVAVDRILVFEKDTRLHALSQGVSKLSIAYRPIPWGSAPPPGSEDQPEKRTIPIDSRSLNISVSGVPLEEMTINLNGVGTKANPYIWYTGKHISATFGQPGQPSLTFKPENVSQKGVNWTFKSECPDTYSSAGIALKESETECLIKCIGEAVGKQGQIVELVAKIKNKGIEGFDIGHQGGIPRIWDKKDGSEKGQGIELGKSFVLFVNAIPEDAYNQKYKVVFSPADAIKDSVDKKNNVTWYKAVKPTQKVTMSVISDEKGADGKPRATRVAEFEIWKIPVTGIEFVNPLDRVSLADNEYQVEARVTPLDDPTNNTKGATITDVSYTVSDEKILEADKNNLGLYKLLKAGSCDITATSVDNPSISATITVKVFDPKNPEAVEDALFAGVTLAPNPFGEKLSVRNGALAGTFDLLNVNGQVLRHGELSADVTTLDTRELPAGSYLLRLNVEGATKTYRVVKK